MVEIHHLYIAALAATAVLALVVAWATWRERRAFRAAAVVTLMLGVSLWCAAEAMLWWVPTAQAQALWLALTYPGSSIVVAAFAVFALEIAEMESWLTPGRLLLVSLAPAAFCVIAVLNPYGLVIGSYVPHGVGSFTLFVGQPGPLYWLYVVGNYVILVAAFGLVLRTYVRSSGAKRIQAKTVFVGSMVPFAVSAANQLGPFRFEGLEAASFFVTGIVYYVAIAQGILMDAGGRLVTARDVAVANESVYMLDTANDYLAGELEAANLAAQALYDQATRDPLTGLYNRRALSEYLTRESIRLLRTGSPFALLMVDVDQLKRVNDSLSHAAGDAVLVAVSESLLVGSRAMDIVCRFGGDEFVLIMSGTDAEAALKRAEELRERAEALTVRLGDLGISISVSIGVATAPEHGTNAAQLMTAADEALHVAKESGRNRVEVAAGVHEH